ncbi:hypothetical protein BpHYR1_006422 [Brachionus plicatilis]|uniref:Uncharacterized protein n=1 Tax=Brachionus plicatilis TaxID=10195 RepID=A0A3M7RMU9_BRAPC|nr:hypothetical protein BpHYR1_006422 [Brachionus plicatilis]
METHSIKKNIPVPFHSIRFIPFQPFHPFHSILTVPFHSNRSIRSIPFQPCFLHDFKIIALEKNLILNQKVIYKKKFYLRKRP